MGRTCAGSPVAKAVSGNKFCNVRLSACTVYDPMYCAWNEVDEERLRWMDRFQTLLYSILKSWLRLLALIDPVGDAAKIFSVLQVIPPQAVPLFVTVLAK